AGALMAKVQSERQAQTYLVDAMQVSDMGMILDFQKKNGYSRYVSPEMAAINKAYKSEPEGYWTWGAIGPAGIAYNPTTVAADPDRAIGGVPRMEGKGSAGCFRHSRGRVAGDPGNLGPADQWPASQCSAAVSRLAAVADRPEGDWRLSLPACDPQRRAAAPGR